MKIVKLLVDDDVIKYAPDCNFDRLTRGMTEPVRIDFDFSPEWANRVAVVAFWSLDGKEYPPKVLKSKKNCIVPTEILLEPAFRVQILGKDNSQRIETTKCTIYLEGGNV